MLSPTIAGQRDAGYRTASRPSDQILPMSSRTTKETELREEARLRRRFTPLGLNLDVNEARVHLWCEKRVRLSDLAVYFCRYSHVSYRSNQHWRVALRCTAECCAP